MATANERLEVEAVLRDRFTAQVNRLGSTIRSFSSRAASQFLAVGRAVTSFRGVLIGVAGGLVLRSMAQLVKSAADVGDRFQKLSIQTGQSTEFLSEMRFAAEQSGVSFESFAKAMTRGTRTLGEFVVYGTAEARDSLEALGTEVLQAAESGKSMEDVLPLIADAMRDLDDQNQKVAISQKIFGRSGADLIPLLEQGSEGIRRFREEAKRLGLTWDRVSADAAAEFNDALDRMTKSFQGLKEEVARGAFTALTEAFDGITEFIVENRSQIREFFGDLIPLVFEAAGESAIFLAKSITGLQASAVGIEEFLERPSALRTILSGGVSNLLVPTKQGGDLERATEERAEKLRKLEERFHELRKARASLGRTVKKMRDAIEGGGRQDTPGEMSLEELEAELDTIVRKARGDGDTSSPPPAESHFRNLVDLGDLGDLRDGIDEVSESVRGLQSGLREVEKRGTAFNVVRNSVVDLAGVLERGLAEPMLAFIDVTGQAEFRFREFANSIIRDIQSIALRGLIQAGLGAAFGAIGGAIGGAAGSTVPTGSDFQRYIGSGPFVPPGFISRQHGGVVDGTSPQFVLSHPPEAWVPLPGPGRGIPVEFSGGSGGVVVNQTIRIDAIDAKSFDERALQSLARNAAAHAAAAADQFRRDPRMRASFAS